MFYIRETTYDKQHILSSKKSKKKIKNLKKKTFSLMLGKVKHVEVA